MENKNIFQTILDKSGRLFGKVLVLVGLKEKKRKTLPPLWRNSAEFQQLYGEIKGRTLVTADRCFMIYQLAKYASRKEGDFAEVGVYKGGTARLIARSSLQKKLHLFDTFAGMPEAKEGVDYHQKGDFNDTSLSSVKDLLKDCPNVSFYQGFFPQMAGPLMGAKFCYVHIDVDIYQSVKDCLQFFYSRMVPGGVMLFDDYEWKDTEGVKIAIDEFLKEKPETPIITTLYQCLLIKA